MPPKKQSGPAVPKMISRPKPPPPGEEIASDEIQLGEFEGVETLSYSEAELVLEALEKKRRKEKRYHETEVLQKTRDHLSLFRRFKTPENVQAAERLLSARPELHKFERAQIASLVPENSDEAKKLIPSLKDKFDDHDLEDLLQELSKFCD
ncbi:hypothetical protein MCOR27_002103 [Pyricularia oryzae]|uniref:Uncharacterized protein n=6 Tax=Pyricularia TaxID=48558 RepID=A0A6P8B9E2_PYRGI|nr:uncharacterized protein MGG_04508 [Pyricularia oryzae 70-15]XP_030983629.1 uncharacterized protein PgNI_03011 [Pyricularia grisea]ELQ33023.1 hypothetical protein OOU_Y34scaffold01005g49 [Pyricularia oryzae Y34]KAH8844848.1 hypothetical protein MCOR01_002112 [Pyricularia oryzae]EHA58335.1 hypothetical protein MGG_04508 [Pyricularia oryzae 70-15]KAH9429298.1 hypothetical protein MCOR02_010704 [Pyricularia oryzae]KAI6263742.1 hypothetical protein MCOR19_000075 [Pyricularia oryzae]